MDKKPVLELKNITKSFYGNSVLKNVGLTIGKGEVLGLIGENGAGKSTLMKIVSGAYAFESGEIYLEGEKIKTISPTHMQRLGVGMVYQDTSLIADLKVFQNIFLCNELTKNGITDDKAMKTESQKLIERFEMDINVNSYVKNLTLAQRQLVEIAKALAYDTKILILDEPTSSLTPKEVEKLFDIVRRLTKEGVSVVFISHRLSELMEICDRFVVLRDGCNAGEVARLGCTEDILSAKMVGRNLNQDTRTEFPDFTKNKIIFRVSDLSDANHFQHISFNLHEGEILGFYGLDGNGQRELLRTLCGLNGEYSGEIILQEKQLHLKSARNAIDAGVSFITNDRHGENIFNILNVGENLTVPNLKKWTKLGFLDQKLTDAKISEGIEQLKVKCYGREQLVRELSGGNQQKVAIAGRFLLDPKLFIFDECTLGVDVGAKGEIYKFLRELTAKGIGVIILSSDMREILSVSDRIIVMASGEIKDVIPSCEATEDRIISAAIKIKSKLEQQTEENAKQNFSTESGEGKPQKNSQSLYQLFGNFLSNSWMPVFTLTAVLAVLFILGGLFSKSFVTAYNIGLIFWQALPLMFLAAGEAVVIMTGHTDLSVSSQISLMTCILSQVLATNMGIPKGIFLVLFAGILCGLINSLVVVKMKVPHFVGTLSTQIVFMGIALAVRTEPGGTIVSPFSSFFKYKIGGNWPVMFFVASGLVIILDYLLHHSKLGIRIYATGSNRQGAFFNGVNVDGTRTIAYVFSGLMAALGGIFLTIRIGCGDASSGQQLAFQAITSAAMGGVVFSGGRGTLTGSMVGAVLIVTIQNVLNMLKISTFWQYVWMGTLILGSVTVYNIIDEQNRKRLEHL